MYFLKMFKIDYFTFIYFLTSKIAVLSNGLPLLNRILFFSEKQAILRNVYLFYKLWYTVQGV
jgi:hypothetical protein